MHPLAGEPFEVKGVRVEPLPVMHYKLPIFGYRIGNLAYITDAKTIPPSTMARLQGIGLHEATSRLLPQGVELAYDKEIIRVP